MTARDTRHHVGHIDGTDLLQQDAIRESVRSTYAGVRPSDRDVAERFYSASELSLLPDETARMALGVGNPVTHAGLHVGESVLDLGSGAGIDCLLAARGVGPSGTVTGVDFLPEMVERAARAAGRIGLDNVHFVRGEIEALPLDDRSVDVVISNGVINLSPRKVRVLSEAYRVLRPGGRLAIVDLVLDDELPADIATHPAAWAGCLSGALSETALYKAVRRAGFRDAEIAPLDDFGIAECALYPLFDADLIELLRRRVPAERHGRIARSVLVLARKVADGERLPGRRRRGNNSHRPDVPPPGRQERTRTMQTTVATDELRTSIRHEYARVAADPAQGFHFHTGRRLARLLGYPDAWLDDLPDAAVDSMAGTGNPFALGKILPGERVVDAGAGSGTDTLIAARMVGSGGRVIGIDMTPEMVDRARLAARSAGIANAAFRVGHLEALPVDDAWADVVTSNGVLNLVPDKPAALREMARVLRPGGRLQVADIVLERPVGDDARGDVSLWTGCIAGGMVAGDLEAMIRKAGFVDVALVPGIDVFAGAPQHSNAAAYGTRGIGIRALRP